jgi:hypothetical protein
VRAVRPAGYFQPLCLFEKHMQTEETVFEKTYQNYLEQLREISFESIAHHLGAKIEGKRLKIPLFIKEHTVSVEGIADASGKKPAHDICVILCKYILRCPHTTPKEHQWVSFRNFKDSGPLINYFTNDVERAIGSYFSGRLNDLKKASNMLGGYPADLEVKYDLAVQFDALPKIPVMMLYNDVDEEFSAKCSVLFESRAEKYLDAECIAMVGWQLSNHLKKALKKS